MKAVLNHWSLYFYLLFHRVSDFVTNLVNEEKIQDPRNLDPNCKPVYRTPRLGR